MNDAFATRAAAMAPRNVTLWMLCIAAGLTVAPVYASDCTLTNADIIKMVEAGLPEAIIFSSMKSCKPQFDLSPDGLFDLKTHKVSDAVIAAMEQPGAVNGNAAGAGAGPAGAGTAAGEAPPVDELGFYIALKRGEMLKAKSVTTTVKGSGGRVAADALIPFAGFARRKHKTTIPGLHAALRLEPEAINYFVYFTSPGTPVDTQSLRLVRAEVVEKKDLRQLSATVSAVTGGQQQEEASIPWTLKVTKVPGLYQMKLDEPLPPGEYAVIFGQFGQERTFGIRDVWDFGID